MNPAAKQVAAVILASLTNALASASPSIMRVADTVSGSARGRVEPEGPGGGGDRSGGGLAGMSAPGAGVTHAQALCHPSQVSLDLALVEVEAFWVAMAGGQAADTIGKGGDSPSVICPRMHQLLRKAAGT